MQRWPRNEGPTLARLAVAALVIAAITFTGCGTASVGAGGPASTSSGAACDPSTAASCSEGAYCAAPSCGQGEGTCTAPSADAGAFAPVCGCDGATYWSAALARSAGVAVRAATACGASAVTCALDGTSCAARFGAHAYCSATVASGQCVPAPSSGVCWVTPAACDELGGTGYACTDPGHCKTACELVTEQAAWYAVTCEPSHV